MFKVNNQETRTTSTVSSLLILHILVSLMLTLDTLYILRDIKYAEIRAFSNPYLHVSETLENTDTILSIHGKLRIRENPYWGLFHPLLLWCFYCWLWTGSCSPGHHSYQLWLVITKSGRKRKVISLTVTKNSIVDACLGFKYASAFWRLFKRFIF